MFTVITAPSVLPFLGLALPTVHLRSGLGYGYWPMSNSMQIVGKCWQACYGRVLHTSNLHCRGQA
jgi:hypothetical protein